MLKSIYLYLYFFKDDGTFETLSQMVFTGTRYENGQNFRCEADNVVIREDIDKPIHDSILLDVRCKFILFLKNI